VISGSPSAEESGEVAGESVTPDPAPPRPSRRTFTARYKSLIVAEYEAAPHGEKSAVLRREGLYHRASAKSCFSRSSAVVGRVGRRRGRDVGWRGRYR